MPLLVPVWLLFEIAQLVACERHLRVAVANTATRPPGPREPIAFVWSVMLLLYYAWMALMLFRQDTRMQMVAMLCVSSAGFALRRVAHLRHVLTFLTCEGAIRIGLLLSMLGQTS